MRLLEEALDSLSTGNNAVSDVDNVVNKSTGDFESTRLISRGLTSEKLKLFTATAIL